MCFERFESIVKLTKDGVPAPGTVQRRSARVRPPALPPVGGEGGLDGVKPPLLGVAAQHHGVGQVSGEQLRLHSPGDITLGVFQNRDTKYFSFKQFTFYSVKLFEI